MAARNLPGLLRAGPRRLYRGEVSDAVAGARWAIIPVGEARLAAAEGRTNREIAQALFVTLRTVEAHLTSSYAKRGITSRRQLGAALARATKSPSAASATLHE